VLKNLLRKYFPLRHDPRTDLTPLSVAGETDEIVAEDAKKRLITSTGVNNPQPLGNRPQAGELTRDIYPCPLSDRGVRAYVPYAIVAGRQPMVTQWQTSGNHGDSDIVGTGCQPDRYF